MKKVLIPLVLILLLLSCTTKYIPVETVKERYINITTIDTLYQKDSIFVQTKNDTVFIEKLHYIYKYKASIDTIIERDTIPEIQKITIVKEVNRIKDWQTVLMVLGGTFILYIILKCKKAIGL